MSPRKVLFQLPEHATKSDRAKFAATLLTPSMLPPRTQPMKCNECGKFLKFALTLGDKNGHQAGQITAGNRNSRCCKWTVVNTVTQREREVFVAALDEYDADQAALKAEDAALKAEAKKATRKTKSANNVNTKTTSSPGKPGKAKETRDAECKATALKGKGKAKEEKIAPPPHKKAKRDDVNVSPAVPSRTESTEKGKKAKANEVAVSGTANVPDTERFKFSETNLFEVSHAGATQDALQYARYSPHRGSWTSVEESGVLGKVNISESGSIVIYRVATLQDWECPGLRRLLFDLHQRSDCIRSVSTTGNSHFPSFPSAGPAAGPSTSQISSLKRAREDSEDEIEDSEDEMEDSSEDEMED
ncbi:hypothetical protein DFH07DRAFT_774224 [Mycena maculata]|uniref:Uncharacterized protein n=1 Tax=Mycena maculata TaxID=230809 RepID=A0AAD7IYG1_9AGAR|nr:hypothetical protein DFH07DRAFT_774224 [Mycena maculata]